MKYIIDNYNALHLLVNNAGGQFVCSAEELSSNGFQSVLHTNLTGTFHVCRAAYDHYMRDHGGSIVNITLGNRNGMPNMSHSGAARAGIENLSISLSQEWMECGIRINCVRPGIVYTDSGSAVRRAKRSLIGYCRQCPPSDWRVRRKYRALSVGSGRGLS